MLLLWYKFISLLTRIFLMEVYSGLKWIMYHLAFQYSSALRFIYSRAYSLYFERILHKKCKIIKQIEFCSSLHKTMKQLNVKTHAFPNKRVCWSVDKPLYIIGDLSNQLFYGDNNYCYHWLWLKIYFRVRLFAFSYY